MLSPIRSRFTKSKFHSYSTNDEEIEPLISSKDERSISQPRFNPGPSGQPQFPFASPKQYPQCHRDSTIPTCPSMPPLTSSPFPSPASFSPSAHCPPTQRFRQVPCPLKTADMVVAEHPSQTSTSKSSSVSPSGHHPIRSKTNQTVVLVGDAILNAVKGERKVQAYRILPEQTSS